MKSQCFDDRLDFLCALKEVGWWHVLQEHTFDRDRFFESYGIRDQWLKDAHDATVDYWCAFPESSVAKLGQFVPAFPKFLPPDDASGLEARLQEHAAAWRALYQPRPEIPDPALWTAFRFCGKPAASIAREYCRESPSRNPEALVEKTVSRFARRIHLTIPDHSRCKHNDFLAPYRAARIAHK